MPRITRVLAPPGGAPSTTARSQSDADSRQLARVRALLAKAALIDKVAGANRCRSVVSEQLGFSTVIGEPIDLESVEVLTTSLLVQAHTAMMRHGSRGDYRGSSRTTSFRRSFVMSYAHRVGERVRAASQEVAEQADHADALLPALRRRAEHVDAT